MLSFQETTNNLQRSSFRSVINTMPQLTCLEVKFNGTYATDLNYAHAISELKFLESLNISKVHVEALAQLKIESQRLNNLEMKIKLMREDIPTLILFLSRHITLRSLKLIALSSIMDRQIFHQIVGALCYLERLEMIPFQADDVES
jgi:hypothetical protein